MREEIDATIAVYEALDYICDIAGSEKVLTELSYHFSIDDLVSFLHYFMQDYDVDTSNLDDECVESLNEYYNLHCRR